MTTTPTKPYNHKNCQSLFGYAAQVHIRWKGQCQLCMCSGTPFSFNWWRQLTVEHLIGRKQGGYLKQILKAVEKHFPTMSHDDQQWLVEKLNEENTVSSCSFCNSTTSRFESKKSMNALLKEAHGNRDEVLRHVRKYLRDVLKRKKEIVGWKLQSIRKAYDAEVHPQIKGS